MDIISVPEKTSIIITFIYNKKKYSLESFIMNKDKNVLYLSPICNHKKPLSEKEISNVSITYLVENGYYEFKNLKFVLAKVNQKYVYVIKNEYSTERINRREYFRVFIGESLKVKVITNSGKTFEILGVLKDLSTTGMGIILNNEIEDVKELEVYFASNTLKATLKGKLIRCSQIEDKKEYIYGCKFNVRNESLSKFVLNHQLKNKLSKDFNKQKRRV